MCQKICFRHNEKLQYENSYGNSSYKLIMLAENLQASAFSSTQLSQCQFENKCHISKGLHMHISIILLIIMKKTKENYSS